MCNIDDFSLIKKIQTNTKPVILTKNVTQTAKLNVTTWKTSTTIKKKQLTTKKNKKQTTRQPKTTTKTTLFIINVQNIKNFHVNKSKPVRNIIKTTSHNPNKVMIIDFESISTKKDKKKSKYNSSNEEYVKTLYKWYEINKIILISGLIIGCIILSIGITTTIINMIRRDIRSEYERLDIIDMTSHNHF